MPFTFTAAPSSRITKPKARKPPSFDRKGIARRASLQQSRPAHASKDVAERTEDDAFEERLEDRGLVKTLTSDLSLRDVVPTMKHILSSQFDDFPAEKSGMNSSRTAEVLNYRKVIPPIVTNAHIHALVNSPTSVEKEISKLARAGLIKRITVPGRGKGSSSLSDGLVLVRDWTALAEDMAELPDTIKGKYTDFLKSGSESAVDLRSNLDGNAITALMRAGLLTASTSMLQSSSNVLTSTRNGVAGTLTSVHSISRAASGSVEAVGGHGAVLISGGGGSTSLGDSITDPFRGVEMSASLPHTGAFLKLLENARSHLVHLLSKSKYREAPLYLLRERWDGNISSRTPYGRSQDPFVRVLPGKTKKWKEFYGLKFDWILAECLGGGLVEVFETGSVGLGVRLL